jgi:F-box-like
MVLRRVTIESLPDEVLLEIFYAYKLKPPLFWQLHHGWLRLVHVCRRWRLVIFASPHRHLQVDFNDHMANIREGHFDNFFAALERRDRVRDIRVRVISLPRLEWERISTVAQGPFPALTSLEVSQSDGLASGDIFFNAAPNLQLLSLRGFSIPRRLGSATHLRSLDLFNIPSSGYMPPETMATCLSALSQLESLTVNFEPPMPRPKQRNRPVPPPTRFTLPALTSFDFRGVSEYLEVLTARIDPPALEHFDVMFFHQLVFDIPQIVQFLGHQDFNLCRLPSLVLRFEVPLYASIIGCDGSRSVVYRILCDRFDRQVSSIAQICNQIVSFRSSVESLNIWCYLEGIPHSEDDVDPIAWLQLFHSFTSVKSLQIAAELEPSIAHTLQGLSEESAAKVFPSLGNLSIVGDVSLADETTQQGIQSFVAAHQHSGRPVTVSRRKSS